MKLLRGDKLTERQRAVVLSAFGYRWTTENTQRATSWHGRQGAPTIPLISDAQWLAEHAFWFLNDGSRLAFNKRHAEPAFLASSLEG